MKPTGDEEGTAGGGCHAVAPLPPGIPADPHVRAAVAYNDRPLCDAALSGDMGAWNALIERHSHRVVVSLLARGVPMDRARDIMQDVWLRLIERQLGGKLTQLELPGLAIVQAGFLALESGRREASLGRHETRGEPDELSRVADPRANVEARLLTEEKFTRAEAILAKRSPSARKVFQLVYGGEGLNHSAVARRLGLSLQRVRQILCEVRKELRTAVEEVVP